MKRTAKLPSIDGIPDFCRISQADRAKSWANRPLTVVPFAQVRTVRNEDEATAAFRAQEDERRRQKSLAGIARMKARMASKTIDYSKMRWDPRKVKFVPLTGDKPAVSMAHVTDYVPPKNPVQIIVGTPNGVVILGDQPDWSRVTKDTARKLAELNGVWDDRYVKLSGGLLVMSVTNRLKGLAKRGTEVKWQ